MIYTPKGSMCMACKKIKDDCSKLEFKNMPVIVYCGGVAIVKCSEFDKKDR